MRVTYPLVLKNDFTFSPSPRDFKVEEIPLYEFSGSGEHLVLKVRKRSLTTWQLIDALASHCNINAKEIGYAGLKDKHAMTIQYISVHKRYESAVMKFEHEGVKILDMRLHANKIKMGHLKGNRFSLRLKRVKVHTKKMLDGSVEWIEKYGIPNYFGDQRFGVDMQNWKIGEQIVHGSYNIRDRRKRRLFINAYQSRLFNLWLKQRVELSLLLKKSTITEAEECFSLSKGMLEGVKEQPHFFKLLDSDLMMHYPFGRLFEAKDLKAEAQKFFAKDRAPTGLLSGKKVKVADGTAGIFESNYVKQIQ